MQFIISPYNQNAMPTRQAIATSGNNEKKMTDYPFPQFARYLQILCTPEEYRRMQQPRPDSKWRRWGSPTPTVLPADDIYWKMLPQYIYAECPLCHRQYRQPIDIYSLEMWGPLPSLDETLYKHGDYALPAPCKHLLGVHTFINLHGNLPKEVKYLSNNNGDIPYLTPWFFADDIQTFAVLFALPLCRVIQEQFIPTYTLFSLTYFSENPKAILSRHYAQEAERGEGDPEFWPATVMNPSNDSKLYDLAKWAVEGKLGWMEVEIDKPTILKIGPGAKIPSVFGTITGFNRRHSWFRKQGKFHFNL